MLPRSVNAAIVVFATHPEHEAATARLAEALAPAQRVALYRAMLHDRIDRVAALDVAAPIVAFAPADAEPAFEAAFGDRVGLLAQRGDGPGERLQNVLADLFARGFGRVVLLDGDAPHLPIDVIEEALEALSGAADVVIGPAWSGGLCVLGLKAPCPALFRGVAWGTRDALAQAVARARGAGLGIAFLPAWYGVETPEDLRRLAADLAATPPARPGFPRRTAEVARALGVADRAPPRDELWRTLSTRPAYQNRWIRVEESVVELPGEKLTLYGVVACPPAVGALPLLGDGRVLLVRQFRYVARRFTWEIPTGGAHPGERLEDAALRELREECGYTARTLRPLGSFHTSKSVVDEVAHLYIAEDLEPAGAPADETEQIEVKAVPFEEALEWVLRGEIVDAMSVIAVLRAARLLRPNDVP